MIGGSQSSTQTCSPLLLLRTHEFGHSWHMRSHLQKSPLAISRVLAVLRLLFVCSKNSRLMHAVASVCRGCTAIQVRSRLQSWRPYHPEGPRWRCDLDSQEFTSAALGRSWRRRCVRLVGITRAPYTSPYLARVPVLRLLFS